MSKAYSNKALPAGTIIREWRLEEVLGVGGFGIVYKGRGIYFGELVAIKEYFPSSISERDEEDTVVPIGSDVEEVHALGLKKFVEEAKLLWNLSTPSRHPNIVSVRALFEIHGTAYMVMDFEDGTSLSKLLKDGRRFNERSLWNIVRPIAEGLDSAHRVGVLHRDIKPPNILINDDGRPVLIDFGSARFEAAEATSTTVTFHTPPYAAIEQYVKTYEQGPWTDIYALGVVLYECVTGEKPPEVLERLHGGAGKSLAEDNWPGFTKRFLQAIDAAMTIRPTERPQSIRDWLALFGKKDVEAADGSDEEATRFYAREVTAEEIMPIAPPAAGAVKKEALETGVPTDPSEVEFKRAGQETGASRKKKDLAATDPANAAEEEAAPADPLPAVAAAAAATPKAPPAKAAGAKGAPKEPAKIPRAALAAAGGAVVLLAAVVGGSMMFNSKSDGTQTASSAPKVIAPAPVGSLDVGGLAAAARALADEARSAGAPASAVSALVTANEQLDQQLEALQPLQNDPKQSREAASRATAMKRTATSANVEFANALLRDAEARAQRLSADVPWANPTGGRATTPQQRAVAGRLSEALSGLRAAVETASGATDPAQSLNAARDTLAKSQTFVAAIPAAYNLQASTRRSAEEAAAAKTAALKPTATARPAATAAVKPTATKTPAAAAVPDKPVSAGKLAQFNGVVDSARSLAKQVMRMGDKRGGDAGAQTRKANAALARNYDSYLANLKDSGRGAKTDKDADKLIKQAGQTKAYLVFLERQSSATLK